MVPDFFGELEAENFPTALLQHHYPDYVKRWELIGATQSCPWMWVMFAELCFVSFLAPTAVLKPLPSIFVYGVLWFFFVHPGTTSTSNLLRLYADALEIVDRIASSGEKIGRNNVAVSKKTVGLVRVVAPMARRILFVVS